MGFVEYIERASRKTSSLVRIYLLPEVAAGLPDRPALCCLHGAALGSNSGGLRMEAAAERPGRPGPEGPRPTLGRGEDTPGAELNPCLPRHAGKARFRCVQRGSRRVSLARWRRQDRRAQVRLRDARIGEPSALHMRFVVLLCIWEVIGTCRWQSL